MFKAALALISHRDLKYFVLPLPESNYDNDNAGTDSFEMTEVFEEHFFFCRVTWILLSGKLSSLGYDINETTGNFYPDLSRNIK